MAGVSEPLWILLLKDQFVFGDGIKVGLKHIQPTLQDGGVSVTTWGSGDHARNRDTYRSHPLSHRSAVF